MPTAVSKWGNSLALRLPRDVAAKARLRDGTTVDFTFEGNRLMIAPSRPRYRLSELLESGKNTRKHGEAENWGSARGKETW
jgi:antitoxin MazE